MRRLNKVPCARCGSAKHERERRPDGCTRCLECGYSQKTTGWETGELGPLMNGGEDVTGPATDSLDDGRDYRPLVSHMAAKMLHRLEKKRAQNNGWLDDHHDTATTTQNVVEKLERKLETLRGRALHHAQMFHADDRCDAFGIAADIANLAAILAELAEGPITDPPTRSIIVDMSAAKVLDGDELYNKVKDAHDPAVLEMLQEMERLASPVLNVPAPDRLIIVDHRSGGGVVDAPRSALTFSVEPHQRPDGAEVAMLQITHAQRGVTTIWIETMEEAGGMHMDLRTAAAIQIEDEDERGYNTCTIA